MDSLRWERIAELFERAVEVPPPEREHFVRREAAGDDTLADIVLRMVRSDATDQVLDRSIDDVAASVFDEVDEPALGAGDRIGDYEILEVLGRGGMGIVYKARDTRLDRLAALKFLPAAASSDAAARVEAEARAASALDHPNIATIYHVGVSADGRPYIAMAHYQGRTLAERLRSGALRPDEAVRIATAVAAGLAAAHERGIVHRDVKPSNIMLLDSGQVKLLDFGIAAAEGGDHDRPAAGTPLYMSPEQNSVVAPHPHTDVWSLGTVLYEMLAGRTPFEASSAAAMLALKAGELPPLPARQGITRKLRAVVSRSLSRTPALRYADAGAMHRELEQYGQSAAQRGRWTLAAAAVVLVVASGIMAQQRLRGPRVTTGSPIVLADIENLTNDSILDRALFAAASVALQESRQIALVPRSRVRETLALMTRKTDTTLDESLAREVARRDGVRRVASIAVAPFDSAYLLTMRLIEPTSGRDLFTARERASSRSAILSALDRLVARSRRALGEGGISTPEAALLPRVTTASLEALEAYARGTEAWTRRNYLAAREDWQRAITIDSGFALAHASLADYYMSSSLDMAAGNRALDRAMAHFDRLTEREQLALKLRVARYRGPVFEEAHLSELIAQRYPSRDSWYSLGTTLMRHRRCDSAIPALRRSLVFDSLFTNGHINLAACHQFLGDYANAVQEYARAQRIDSVALLSGNLNFEWGHAVFRHQGPVAAESVFRLMLRRTTRSEVAAGWRSLAFISMYEGRYREAIRRLDSAVVLARLARAALTEYRNLMLLAQVMITAGDTNSARAALTQARELEAKLTPASLFLVFSVHAHTRAGLLGAARRTQAKARGAASPALEADRNSLALIEAMILSAEGRHVEAMRALREARDTTLAVWVNSLRADAFAAMGKPDSALAEARILANGVYFGFEKEDEWLRSLLRVARLSERTGDTVAALAAYEAYVARWSQGDEDLPELREARSAIGRLSPSRGDSARTFPARKR